METEERNEDNGIVMLKLSLSIVFLYVSLLNNS